MLIKLRNRMAREESGFTLIELLVVMLILGILAAIAIPAFLNQREKGQDADAKADVRTTETAMETYATDNDGAYTLDENDLIPIEGVMNDIVGDLAINAPGAGEAYNITVTSDSGNTFTLVRMSSGDKNRTCTGDGGCVGGTW